MAQDRVGTSESEMMPKRSSMSKLRSAGACITQYYDIGNLLYVRLHMTCGKRQFLERYHTHLRPERKSAFADLA